MSRKNKNQSQLIQGVVKRNPDGFGFLIPDDKTHPDVYLPRHTMVGIMTDDHVEIETIRERDGRFSGEVRGIIARAFKNIVGQFIRTQHGGMIPDSGLAWGTDLFISAENMGNAKNGELVAVEILTYSDAREGLTGRVIEVLGAYGDPLHDTRQALYAHHVPIDFQRETLAEVAALPDEVAPSEFQGRVDLQHLKFVTIDGSTAKDFDDAVYAEKTEGGFRVWVAIADVSHYVKPNTSLDRDAYLRGTSVYFPDLVIPMLPEKLSNGLCSLNPHVPRLALVAQIDINFHGQIVKTEFFEAVFQSRHRMIYGEVQEIIDGTENPKYIDVTPTLKLMSDIAHILMKKRFNEGSLDLEIPEPQIILDPTGNPVDVIRSERLFSHRLIEELMLLANIAVARYIHQSQTPSLYRVHESPFEDSLKNLAVMAHNWGIKAHFGSKMIQKSLMHMLDAVKDRPEANILSILILRSMKQAQYSSESIGHFGLAFQDYTHFTSPIRRYPDLIVHRVLKKLIRKERRELYSAEKMAEMGAFLSDCEQRANKVTRDVIAVKKCRFMRRHLNDVLEGMVTGVAKFGFFVQIRLYDIDGLVKLETLKADRYTYVEEQQMLLGKRTRNMIRLGDIVKVRLMRADPEARQIDFEWIDEPNAVNNDRPPDRSDIQERRPAQEDRKHFRKARFPQRTGKSKAGSVHSKKANKGRRGGKAKRR